MCRLPAWSRGAHSRTVRISITPSRTSRESADLLRARAKPLHSGPRLQNKALQTRKGTRKGAFCYIGLTAFCLRGRSGAFLAEQRAEDAARNRACKEKLEQERHREIHDGSLYPDGEELRIVAVLEQQGRKKAHAGGT